MLFLLIVVLYKCSPYVVMQISIFLHQRCLYISIVKDQWHCVFGSELYTAGCIFLFDVLLRCYLCFEQLYIFITSSNAECFPCELHIKGGFLPFLFSLFSKNIHDFMKWNYSHICISKSLCMYDLLCHLLQWWR